MRAVIERVTSDQVSGWAVDDGHPDEPLTVHLILGGQIIAQTKAATFRDDLKRNGLGNGCYGYIFSLSGAEALLTRYLDDQLEIKVTSADGESAMARPADYLHQEIKIATFLEKLGRFEFPDFLARVLEVDCASFPNEAQGLLNLLNVSRAHFPEWRRSKTFAELAVAAARSANARHTLSYYEKHLVHCEHAASDEHAARETTPLQDRADVRRRKPALTYGAFADWVRTRAKISATVVRPQWPFGGGNPISFLEEAGILPIEEADAEATPILAFREYAFGAPTWHVSRHGKPHAVARNLYYLSFEQLRSVLDNGGVVLIDMSNEGPPDDPFWIGVLNFAIDDLEIPIDQLLYVTQNLRFDCREQLGALKSYVAHSHYFISTGIAVLKKDFPSDADIREHSTRLIEGRANLNDQDLKHYICMNFTPRWHRWAVVLYLSLRNYLNNGYVSFPGKSNFKLAEREFDKLEAFFTPLNQRVELLAHLPTLLQKCPMILDIVPTATRFTPDYEFPIHFMQRSLVQIVTESEVTDGESECRVTEKILKPIVGLQPFVIVGNPRSLNLLQSMGFRTFDKIFDESYDQILNPARRMDAIFHIIDQIANWPIEELRERVSELTDDLVHNFVHLLSVGPLLFGGAVQSRLLNTIASMRGIA